MRSKKTTIIWLIIIFSIAIVGGLVFYFTPLSNRFFPARLDKRYRQQLQQICQQFHLDSGWSSLFALVRQADTPTKQQQAKQQINQLRDKFLTLRVSKRYQDLHFNLVIVLSLLEQGLDNNPDKIIIAEERLQQLSNDHLWITTN